MQELRATQLRAPGAVLPARLAVWLWLAVSLALAAGARALPAWPITGTPAGVSFGATCALALSLALLILAFIKGAFAWVTVINTGTSAVVASRAPDMDRRVHRPPRATPALSTRLPLPSTPLPQPHHLPRRPIPDGPSPGATAPPRPLPLPAAALAWNSVVARLQVAPPEQARGPVVEPHPELVGDLSSAISRIRACAAARDAPR